MIRTCKILLLGILIPSIALGFLWRHFTVGLSVGWDLADELTSKLLKNPRL